MKKTKKHIKEEIEKEDIKIIRDLIRWEVSKIFYDLYRKRKTWSK